MSVATRPSRSTAPPASTAPRRHWVIGVSWIVSATGACAAALAFSIMLTTIAQLFLVAVHAPTIWLDRLPLTVSILPILFGVIAIMPTLARMFGAPVNHVLPRRWRGPARMRSLSDHCRSLRRLLIWLASLPLLSLIASEVILLGEFHWSLPTATWFDVAMILGTGGLGFAWLQLAPWAYRESREQKIRRGLRFYHRGVSLRSFIAPWDNPDRKIFQTCRVSRRLASAQRAVVFTVAACYAAAGCLAARINAPLFLSELTVLGSILAIGSLWPSPRRTVIWSGLILDPFCADREEYEVVE